MTDRKSDIIYYGSILSTDCDFPLLRQFQAKGLNFKAYFLLSRWNRRGGLIDVKEMMKKDVIVKASEIPGFAVYASYLDLDDIYVINLYHHKRYDPRSWWMWLKVLRHMRKHRPTVFHTAWPLAKGAKLLYNLRAKRVVTVHDPLPHSSQINSYNEKCRRRSFSTADSLILLSDPHVEAFCKEYAIDRAKIRMSSLGEYDCMRSLESGKAEVGSPYILFFGQIQSHKGIDDLLAAMVKVHERHPEVKLVIAGKGKFHFDIEPYKRLGYVEFRNYYITVPELAGLLQGCLFAVCPYKDATQSGVVQTAFSADVPLVVTNVGALPRAVTDGVTGLVVPPCDPDALARAMEKLIASPALLEQFRTNIRTRWRPSMSWEPIARQYIQCYKELTQ